MHAGLVVHIAVFRTTGKRSIPQCLLFTFLSGHELFMSAYLYAVRGKRVKTPATHTIATVSVANAFWSSDPCPVRLCVWLTQPVQLQIQDWCKGGAYSYIYVTRSRKGGPFPQKSDCELDLSADSAKNVVHTRENRLTLARSVPKLQSFEYHTRPFIGFEISAFISVL